MQWPGMSTPTLLLHRLGRNSQVGTAEHTSTQVDTNAAIQCLPLGATDMILTYTQHTHSHTHKGEGEARRVSGTEKGKASFYIAL